MIFLMKEGKNYLQVKLFTSFDDMINRIDFLRSPDKLISKRIELELTDPNQKYRLFTRPPLTKKSY
jgi:predicted nucleic acid-binding OB-fold protein